MNKLLRGILLIILGLYLAPSLIAQQNWSTDYAYYGTGGKLAYTPDDEGNIFPDFSHVGYRYGDDSIPVIGTVLEVNPVDGDDGATIQEAIDIVAAMSPDENGFRGAILLKAGIYEIEGQLVVNESGIVLRGEGQGEDGTILRATGTSTRTLLEFGTSGSLSQEAATKVQIAEDYVPVGRKYVILENASAYAEGDQISLYRPGTSTWISDIRMDQISNDDDGTPSTQWSPVVYSFYFEREITKVSGDTIFFRNPVVMALDKYYGGGFVLKTSMNRIENVGVENICFKSAYSGATDEDHSWTAVQFNNVQHGWARDVTSWYFAYACVSVEDDAKFISVIDCSCFEPKSIITGGRRYSFNCVGQMNLFKGCVTTEGRHDFVTSSRVCGPNVFTQCSASYAYSDIGPHHRWAMGTLYDVIVSDNEINVQDRDNMGSGHGWAGANQVFWNCEASGSVCQSPWASAKNYNIGFQGNKLPGYRSNRPDGEWVGHNKGGLFPASLYEAQLEDRLSDKIIFSALYQLEALSDTSFRMHFNLPLKSSSLVTENFIIGGSAGLASASYTMEINDAYSVDFTFSGVGYLPALTSLTITAENVLAEGDLSLNGLNRSVHIEPDKRPVVSGIQMDITNESGSFAVLQSTKLGYVYLIRIGEDKETVEDFELALEAMKAVRAEVTKVNVSIPVYTEGIYGGIYLMYAIDEVGRISEAGNQIVNVEQVISVSGLNMAKEQDFRIRTEGRSLFVHPANPAEEFRVQVFDINGRLVHDKTSQRGICQLPIMANQLLIVKIVSANKQQTHKVFLFE